MSLVVAGVVVVGTWSLFRRSLHLLFDGVPENIQLSEVRDCLLGLPNVLAVHDLHVWAMATSRNSLTADLVVAGDDIDIDAPLRLAMTELHEHFDLEHVTLQRESERYAADCAARVPACAG